MSLRSRVSSTRAKSWFASAVLHVLVLGLLYSPVRFLEIAPSPGRIGQNGSATELVYLSQLGSAPAEVNRQKSQPSSRLVFPRTPEKKKVRPSRKPSPQPASAESARAGSPNGSLLDGPISDHDVRPALPIHFVNPDFHSLHIPPDVRGNVIAEVKIDRAGKVVGVSLVEGLGHGIDEQVLEALLLWRYRPATLDGMAVPEQHLVVYPYPR